MKTAVFITNDGFNSESAILFTFTAPSYKEKTQNGALAYRMEFFSQNGFRENISGGGGKLFKKRSRSI